MPNELSSKKALDRLLSGLEELVLSAPADEAPDAADVRDVQQLITRQIAARSEPRRARKVNKNAFDERVALLRHLLSANGGQHPLLQAAFSSTEKPSSDQIEQAIAELMKKRPQR